MSWLKQIFGKPSVPPTHSVTDDSGFLAIIDPDAYCGFVHPDWTLTTLGQHFIQEMKERHMLIWGTGLNHFWKIGVIYQPAKISGFREIVGTICASKGRLLLTNYESLTMAARYSDVTLPQSHQQDLILTVSPGIYSCRIVQLSDPESSKPFEEPVSFIYELTPAGSGTEQSVWNKVPWSDDF